jgi:hypothetical protein
MRWAGPRWNLTKTQEKTKKKKGSKNRVSSKSNLKYKIFFTITIIFYP